MTNSPASARAPVFVVGSARSGNTLLYHMLLSSGNFAVYRTEPVVFDLLEPRFGGLKSLRSRRNLLEVWLRSKQFRRSGLTREQVEHIVLSNCAGPGTFLKSIMGEIARLQGVPRWAVWGPDNLLYMPRIKQEIPDALFLHTIRDGRDVAACMNREGWIRPFPWDRRKRLLVSGMHWRWKVRRGRALANAVAPDYLEVRFEDLVMEPRRALSAIGSFIAADLDYGRILETGIGAVRQPNSSFPLKPGQAADPVGRWKNVLSAGEVAALEASIGDLLAELGYPLETERQPQTQSLSSLFRRAVYSGYFGGRHWLKSSTPLGRYASTGRLCLE
jgi:hypothetical protein